MGLPSRAFAGSGGSHGSDRRFDPGKPGYRIATDWVTAGFLNSTCPCILAASLMSYGEDVSCGRISSVVNPPSCCSPPPPQPSAYSHRKPHNRRKPHNCRTRSRHRNTGRKRKQAKCRHHHRQQLVSGRVLVRDSATWPSNPTSSEEMAVMASRSMELNVQSGRGKDVSATFPFGQLLAQRPSHASGASPLGLAAPSPSSSSLRVGKGPAKGPSADCPPFFLASLPLWCSPFLNTLPLLRSLVCKLPRMRPRWVMTGPHGTLSS